MKITEGNMEQDVAVIRIGGRIDSANSAQAEAEIAKLLEGKQQKYIVLDAEELEYISSAGLRVILRLRKARPELKIINVSPEVYEIFDMTGFTEMMKVEKAYRRISVEGCEVIGQGANGKVYRIDPDTIIKVYQNPDSLPDIHRERELARKAFVLGIPTAIPYDVVKVGDGYGSVFELLNAKSFAKLIIAHPEKLDEYMELYVDLLKKIHSTVIQPGDMPDMREVVLGWADYLADYLPEGQYGKLRELVAAVPQDQHMLHGDYHIKNVMMQNGEVLLIDMDTICVGHPVFEFASIYLAYLGFSEIDRSNVEQFLGISYETAEQIWRKTLQLYYGTEEEEKLSYFADRAMLVGYTRMMRRTIRRGGLETPEGRQQIELCRQHLAELLERVDSLV